MHRRRHFDTPRGFGAGLSPVDFRRRNARPVSCYALFKWWLLLSQHPGCLSTPTSLVTKLNFGTLADGLGCFPLDREAYPPRTDSYDTVYGIQSLIGFGSLVGPLVHSVLYPRKLSRKASPKAISERTSYCRVRLAFHP